MHLYKDFLSIDSNQDFLRHIKNMHNKWLQNIHQLPLIETVSMAVGQHNHTTENDNPV